MFEMTYRVMDTTTGTCLWEGTYMREACRVYARLVALARAQLSMTSFSVYERREAGGDWVRVY